MSDKVHNLDEGNAEYFEFILRGHTYRMRYPSPKELKAIAEEKDSTAQETMVYDFIEAVGDGSPPLKDVLEEVPVNVLNRFNRMITAEFMGTVNESA